MTVAAIRLGLLGGFRVERADAALPASVWRRRSAKALTKLLGTHPGHALHREQILEILWPAVDVESAANSFAKALHAARRALEPNLQPRESSAYLHLRDGMVMLDTKHVLIDADHFERLAESALRLGSVSAYETALAAYAGDLLPEDRYADWCADRRTSLADLYARLLSGLAEALEKRGAYSEAADRLRLVLHQDPTREGVHRRLMRLYWEMGNRSEALRQFEICRDVLHRELHIEPEKETEALYEDLLADRISKRSTGFSTPAPETLFVGRNSVLQRLHEQLARAEEGRGSLILVSGEAGVGKTRLVAEFVAATRDELTVLWGGSGALPDHFPYGWLAVALEGYVASRPEAERRKLARQYPELVELVPSLGMRSRSRPPRTDRHSDAHLHVLPAIVRLLTDLTARRPVLIVLGDLQDTHSSNLELLQYVTHLAASRPWLVIGTVREEELAARSELRRVLDAATRERLCLHIELQRLGRQHCDQLVQTLLPGGVADDTLRDDIYSLSLGNPLFVEELIGEMRQWNELAHVDGSRQETSALSRHVPPRVRGLVEMQVAAMEESVRRVLALAAVAGMEFTLNELGTAAASLRPPLASDTVADALDSALRACILEERHDSYSFRHPLVRTALYPGVIATPPHQFQTAIGHSEKK